MIDEIDQMTWPDSNRVQKTKFVCTRKSISTRSETGQLTFGITDIHYPCQVMRAPWQSWRCDHCARDSHWARCVVQERQSDTTRAPIYRERESRHLESLTNIT